MSEIIFCRVIGGLAIGLFIYRLYKREDRENMLETLYLSFLILIVGALIIETLIG